MMMSFDEETTTDDDDGAGVKVVDLLLQGTTATATATATTNDIDIDIDIDDDDDAAAVMNNLDDPPPPPPAAQPAVISSSSTAAGYYDDNDDDDGGGGGGCETMAVPMVMDDGGDNGRSSPHQGHHHHNSNFDNIDDDGGGGGGDMANIDDHDSDDDDDDAAAAAAPHHPFRASKRTRELFGASFDDIQAQTSTTTKKKSGGGGGGMRSKLSRELQILMGEANMHYVNKNLSNAVEILQEIVRLAPHSPDPYHLLGLIYEESGDKRKSLEFDMIAAHLTPKDAGLWKRIAVMARDVQQHEKAIYCFSKAIKLDPEDHDSIWERCLSYGDIGQYKKANEGLLLLLQQHPHYPESLEIAKEIARMYMKNHQPHQAMEILDEQTTTDQNEIHESSKVNLELVHMRTELFMELKQYQKAIELIGETKKKFPDSEEFPVEFTVNYGICLALLGKIDKAKKYTQYLMKCGVNDYGDLYFNVAETYMSVNQADEAIRFYEKLRENSSFDTPLVWLKQGKCYDVLGRKAEARKQFSAVFSAKPENVDAAISLSNLMAQSGQSEEALKILDINMRSSDKNEMVKNANNVQNNENTEKTDESRDVRVIVQKGMTMFAMGLYEEVLDVLLPFALEGIRDRRKKRKKYKRKGVSSSLQEPSRPIREDGVFMTRGSGARKTGAGGKSQSYELSLLSDDVQVVDILGVDVFTDVVLKVCKVLCHYRRFDEVENILSGTKAKYRVIDKTKNDEMKLLSLAIAYNNEDYSTAYDLIRFFCHQRPKNALVWNLYNQIVIRGGYYQDSGNRKFAVRLLQKFPNSLPANIFVGHLCLFHGSYSLALSEYFRAFKEMKDDPLLNLCIGVCYLQHSMKKLTPDPNFCILEAFAFLYQYLRLQNSNQEGLYNLGRAHHQLGLYHLAYYYYQKVLEGPSPTDSALDLKSEAAYNMSLMFRESESPELARQVLRKHISF